MAGHHPWSELRKDMSPERRSQVEALYQQKRLGLLIADLRKHSGLTQTELAERLGIGQSTISQMEASEDMHLTTLKKIIAELGGQVVLQMPAGDIPLTAPVETAPAESL